MRTSINWVAVGSIAGVIAAIAAVIAVFNLNGQSAGPIPVPSASTGSKAGSPTTPPPSPAGGNGGAPAIYHRGQLILAYATCVDLDAPPGDRQWGEVPIDASSGGIDFCSQSPDFVGTGGAAIVTVNSGADITCQNATGWLRQNSYQDLNLSVGSFVCVHTNQGRYSLLRVEAIDSTTSSITFSVKTFKKPGDPTGTATAGGGSGAASNRGAPAIYHRGRLTLAHATCADLDAPPGDRQWGEVSIDASSGGIDFCSQSPQFVGTGGAAIVTVNSGTDITCQNATGWLRQNYYQDLNLSVGSFVCVHTNQGRYSLLRVKAIDSTTSSITFSVKTFKKPGD